MRRVLIVALLAGAFCSRPRVPVNTLLWHVESWTPVATGARRAPASFIGFRAHGEFIEHICYVIEQPDTSVYLSASDVHVIRIGKWEKDGAKIEVMPQLVARMLGGRTESDMRLCSATEFKISGNSVIGHDDKQYSPMTRLVAPDFESYINDARRFGTSCPQPPK